MSTNFSRLFGIVLRHSYYADGVARGISLEPTPDCRDLLRRYGLLFRSSSNGCTVYCETGADGTTMTRSFADAPPVFRFLLTPTDPALFNITQFPRTIAPGSRLLCYDNLSDYGEESDPKSLLLGDGEAGASPVSSYRLATGSFIRFPFDTPIPKASFTLYDRFDNAYPAGSFALPDGDTAEEWTVDLGSADRLGPGRYRIEATFDGGTRNEEILYLPGLFGGHPIGLIELFGDTSGTAGAANRVPADYRFTEGENATGIGEYFIAFDSRSIRVSYSIQQAYEAGTYDMENLAIGDESGGTWTAVDDDSARTFTSVELRRMKEQPDLLKLQYSESTGAPAATIRTLPGPNPTNPFTEIDNEYMSEIHIRI